MFRKHHTPNQSFQYEMDQEYGDFCTSKVSGNLFENYGRFPFNKNSSVKLRKFHVPNGTVHYDCTDPTQATARLVIVLVSRIQKSGTGNNNFVNSVRPTEMSGPLVPGQSKPK